jgi:hypothetical protein
VPVKWLENPLLGGWVSAQRYKHNAGKLRKDFAERLNSIGFEWRAPNTFLQSGIPLTKRIEALLAHKAEHGHLTVSRSSEKYPGLAQWMTEQRKLFKDGTISEELKWQLDAIGFPWKPVSLDTDKQWFETFARYKEYAAANGVLAVRVVDAETRKLNRWVLFATVAGNVRRIVQISRRARALSRSCQVAEKPKVGKLGCHATRSQGRGKTVRGPHCKTQCARFFMAGQCRSWIAFA